MGFMNIRRLTLATLAVLCAAGCGLLGSVAVAQAPSPVVVSESVLNVSSDNVTFQAEVNPEGTVTTYRFEYDTSEYASSASHGESVPSPEGSVGAGSSPVTVEAHVQGLSATT